MSGAAERAPGSAPPSLTYLSSKFKMSGLDVKPKIVCGRERPVYKHAQHTHKAFESLNEMRR